MILPDLILTSRVNQHWNFSGMDSIESCLDKKHFKKYPHSISYDYNSRGFRDSEWPGSVSELQNSLWCLGDSFTVGLGSPYQHTWPFVLQEKLQVRTINVSMDGASNQWIARRTQQILQHIGPKIIIIQWSYLNRYEDNNFTLSDEDRRRHFDINLFDLKEQWSTFVKLVDKIATASTKTKIIHSFIPGSGINDVKQVIEKNWNNIKGKDWPACPTSTNEFVMLDQVVVEELKNIYKEYDFLQQYFAVCSHTCIPEIKQLDWARDGHHYDLLTAQQFVSDILQLLSHGRH